MKNGFKLTLMTVALAFGAMTAQATAPTIVNFPTTIVVGDQEGNSAAVPLTNDFTFATDLDLLLSVVDDDPATNQIWSYKRTGTQIYSVNNAPAAAAGATDTDLVTPSTWLFTNSSATNDPADLTSYTYQHPKSDNAPKTITIRNQTLSPIGGPNSFSGPVGTISGSNGVLEFIVSDGTVVGAHKTVAVYSVNDGPDQKLGQGSVVLNTSFTDGTHGWVTVKIANSTGVPNIITGTQDGALGLCIDVGATATASGDLHFDSAPDVSNATSAVDNNTGWVTLVGNAAYRVRTELSTTATNGGLANNQPEVLIQWTSKFATWGGANLYLDNAGHANSAITGFSPIVDTWITPPGVLASPWTTGLTPGQLPEYADGLAAGTDSVKYTLTFPAQAGGTVSAGYVMDFKVFFRVYDRNDALNSDVRNGIVCMKNILIERFAISDFTVASTPYDTDTTGGMKDGTGSADPASTTALQGWKVNDTKTNTSTNFAGNVLSCAPSTTVSQGWGTDALDIIRPGNGVETTQNATTGTITCYTSAAPIPWISNQLLLGRFYMSSGQTSADVSKSVDNILLGFDSPFTAEVAGVSFMTGNVYRSANGAAIDSNPTQPFGPGMPKFAMDQWVVLYNSNIRSNVGTLVYPAGNQPPTSVGQPIAVGGEKLRPRMDLSVTPGLNINGNATSTAAVKIHRVKVDVLSQ